MADLGLLNFGIGGSIDSSYTQAIEQAKKQAQGLQDVLSNGKGIQVNVNTEAFNTASTAAKQMGETIVGSNAKSAESVRNLERALKQMQDLYDKLPNKQSTSGNSLLTNIEKIKAELASIPKQGGKVIDLGGEDSIKRMESELSKMTSQYEKLSDVERESGKGIELAGNIRNARQELMLLKEDISNIKFTGADDSIRSMKAELKELQVQYERLSEAERNSGTGQNLLSSIKQQESAIQNMTRSLNEIIVTGKQIGRAHV